MHRSSSSTAPAEDKENTPPRGRRVRKRPVEAEEPSPDPPTLDRSGGESALEDLGRTGKPEDLLAISRGIASRLPDDAARTLLTLGVAVPGPAAVTAACAQLCRPGLSSDVVPSLGDPRAARTCTPTSRRTSSASSGFSRGCLQRATCATARQYVESDPRQVLLRP